MACFDQDSIFGVLKQNPGGKVVTLKSIEESSHIVMQETPMQVSLLAKC